MLQRNNNGLCMQKKVLITSPRAPVSIEWIRIMQTSGWSVSVIDSLVCPVGRYCPGVEYIQVPAPRLDFLGYKNSILQNIEQFDLVIPTCEDIFFLSMALMGTGLESRVFIPENKLLFSLHNKFTFKDYMNHHVKVPGMRLIESENQIDFHVKNTLLKPVFSRFGRNIIRDVTYKNTRSLVISSQYPWVQQEFIEGKPLCNYAIIQNGKVISHVVYIPKYLVNNAASTYFEFTTNNKCNDFIEQFAKDTKYNGQVAFDFIDDGKDLYVLECNPRATSGLHLISESISFENGNFISNNKNPHESCRVSVSIYIIFGFSYLLNRKIKELNKDYNKAIDVAKVISVKAQVFSLVEMIWRTFYYRKPFTSASTFDIEYDGTL